MAVEFVSNSSAQHELPQTWPTGPSNFEGILPSALIGWSTWQYIVTFLLGVVVYDQGTQFEHRLHGSCS
jgi:C-22 sterol desaturase